MCGVRLLALTTWVRDIQEGEEITIAYGKEWEHVWYAHVQKWVLQEGYKQLNIEKHHR
jgi:hypothetical protein